MLYGLWLDPHPPSSYHTEKSYIGIFGNHQIKFSDAANQNAQIHNFRIIQSETP